MLVHRAILGNTSTKLQLPTILFNLFSSLVKCKTSIALKVAWSQKHNRPQPTPRVALIAFYLLFLKTCRVMSFAFAVGVSFRKLTEGKK